MNKLNKEQKKEYRNLSGIYFRTKIGEHFENVCFEELSEKRKNEILDITNDEFIKNLAKQLANTINKIGE